MAVSVADSRPLRRGRRHLPEDAGEEVHDGEDDDQEPPDLEHLRARGSRRGTQALPAGSPHRARSLILVRCWGARRAARSEFAACGQARTNEKHVFTQSGHSHKGWAIQDLAKEGESIVPVGTTELQAAFGFRAKKSHKIIHPGFGTFWIRAPGYDRKFEDGQGAEQRRFDQAADIWAVGADHRNEGSTRSLGKSPSRRQQMHSNQDAGSREEGEGV